MILYLKKALRAGLGGNPFGPAGTGKTESVKALGNLLGRQVLVFNCDEVQLVLYYGIFFSAFDANLCRHFYDLMLSFCYSVVFKIILKCILKMCIINFTGARCQVNGSHIRRSLSGKTIIIAVHSNVYI